MFKQLKDKIVAMVDSLTEIEQVFNYEAQDFGGDPVVTVTPSENDSEYHSNRENIRVYAFVVRCWVDRTKRNHAQAEVVLTEIVDKVIDLFDRYYTLGSGSPGSALVIPTGYTMIRTEAAPSAWFYVDRPEGYRMAEITIRCHVHADVTLISS